MTPEGKILSKLTKWLRERGVRFIRLALQPSVQRGWPDLCVLVPGGAPLFLELKRPGGVASPTQLLRMEELRNAGYLVEICDSFDAAARAVTQALDARAVPAPR